MHITLPPAPRPERQTSVLCTTAETSMKLAVEARTPGCPHLPLITSPPQCAMAHTEPQRRHSNATNAAGGCPPFLLRTRSPRSRACALPPAPWPLPPPCPWVPGARRGACGHVAPPPPRCRLQPAINTPRVQVISMAAGWCMQLSNA